MNVPCCFLILYLLFTVELYGDRNNNNALILNCV